MEGEKVMGPNPIREILGGGFEWIYLYTNENGTNVWDFIISPAGAANLQAIYDLPSPSGIEGDVYR